MTTMKIRPWEVGKEAVVVVGIEGIVDAIGDGTITVNGLTFPTRLNSERGIHYISMTWPEGDETTCSRDHCSDACQQTRDEEDLEDRIGQFARLVREHHYREHGGALRVCQVALCQMADEEGA